MDRQVLFPGHVTFTLTNRCNLRCSMCGQWGREGYMKHSSLTAEMPVERWMELADEVVQEGSSVIGIRGGEPFLYPGIEKLLKYLAHKKIFVYIDSNGTLLERYAELIVESGANAVNVSLDGPEEVHDSVRGMKGAYASLKKGVFRLRELKPHDPPVVTTAVFTISDRSYISLPDLPDAVRDLGVPEIAIVPYYYFPSTVGEKYQKIMLDEFGVKAVSWKGFFRENSGVDPEKFRHVFRAFLGNLKNVKLSSFMKFKEEYYLEWFKNCTSVVGKYRCQNAWKLLDIQPDGKTDFCVDFPDFSPGNASGQSLKEIYNSQAAEKFRVYYEKADLPVCRRCGVKYMAGNEPE